MNLQALSEREEQVIRLIVDHAACPTEISSHLGISVKTVHVYLDRVKAKLGVKNTTQAALQWDRLQRGVALAPVPMPVPTVQPGPDSLLRDFNTCPGCRGLGFVRKEA